MLPSQAFNEPETFDHDVRQPGRHFLSTNPNPVKSDWKGKEYWQRSLPDLRRLTHAVCAYSSTWIPHSTGCHSIDHFVAKRTDASLAYEWSNFRYVSTRFNSRKGRFIIVDPNEMLFNWFVMDFSSFLIKPNVGQLDNDQLSLALNTINVLHFNDDEELIMERLTYYEDYINNHISFEYLNRKAPFIAFEVNRQNLRI